MHSQPTLVDTRKLFFNNVKPSCGKKSLKMQALSSSSKVDYENLTETWTGRRSVHFFVLSFFLGSSFFTIWNF